MLRLQSFVKWSSLLKGCLTHLTIATLSLWGRLPQTMQEPIWCRLAFKSVAPSILHARHGKVLEVLVLLEFSFVSFLFCITKVPVTTQWFFPELFGKEILYFVISLVSLKNVMNTSNFCFEVCLHNLSLTTFCVQSWFTCEGSFDSSLLRTDVLATSERRFNVFKYLSI